MSEDPDTRLYFVVEGRVGRLTVWPSTSRVPLDWPVAFGPGTRRQCERYLAEHRQLAHH